MPVYPDIIRYYWPCQDGTYSDHGGRGACNWHGGLSSPDPIELGTGGSGRLGVTDVQLNQVKTKPEWFQNRAGGFSTRSVDNIVNAARSGNFSWANFDPVALWEAPGGELYVLSGHSRTEAFARLYAAGTKVDGRDFSRIPAKIVRGISEQEARKIAMESNTLSTKETDLERAAYYRRLRVMDNTPAREIDQAAKRMEGRNASHILALSYLSPSGKTLASLSALSEAEDTSRGVIGNVARWIGNARKAFPMLTDQHENELYDFLITHKGYGTSRGQISNEREFSNRLASVINRRTEFGVFPADRPLNLLNLVTKSPVEQTYDDQVEDARRKIAELEKAVKDKTRELTARGATEDQVREITASLEAALRRSRIEYTNLLQSKGRVMEAARNELNLFEGISGIKKRQRWQSPRYL